MNEGRLNEALKTPAAVKVWDLPLRVLHWALAASVLVAYFTANIFDAVHEWTGYCALVLAALRLIWGFAGTRYARFRSFVRTPRIVARFLAQIARGEAGRYRGLNPAGGAMALALLALIAISTISGWMQITERFFGVAWVETVHSYSSHLILILVAVHVVGVLLMCVLQRENLVWAMITGRKRERNNWS